MNLDILGLDKTSNPKEATCKGGLLPVSQQTVPEKLILKNSSGALVGYTDTYSSLDESSRYKIVKSVEHFFRFVLNELPSSFNLDDNFGVSVKSIALAKEECMKDLDTYLNKGIDISAHESGNIANKIEDALVFYPIKGVIQALSTRLEKFYKND